MFEESQEYDFEAHDEDDYPHQQVSEFNNDCDVVNGSDHYQETIQQPKISQIDTAKTKERYYTLQNQKTQTKNIPHVLGYHFAKFMQNIIEKKIIEENQLPEVLRTFLGKKIKAKTVTYGLDDYKVLFSDQVSKTWFTFYLQNISFVDFVRSNKIKNSESYILQIEHYLAGSQKPEAFNSNRNQQDKKSDLKEQKQNLKKSQQAAKEREETANDLIQFEALNLDSQFIDQ